MNRSVVVPAADCWVPVWDRPVPYSGDRAPLVWLLGAHGGAGVSTLERMLAPAADACGRWPGVLDNESPFVVVVARETLEGLARAHQLLRQHHGGHGGPSRVLGLITCADRPGRVPLEIRRYRRVIDELVPPGGRWRVGWQPEWPVTRRVDLPVWEPASCYPKHGSDPLAAIRPLGQQLLGAVTTVTDQDRMSGTAA